MSPQGQRWEKGGRLFLAALRSAIFEGVGFEEFAGGFGDFDSIAGDLEVGNPGNAVEYAFAEVVVLPVVVVMKTSEPEASAVVVVFATLVGPGDVLRFTGSDGLADSRIAGVRAVFAFHGFLGSNC